MLTFIPSRDERTIAVEFSGKATAEDAEKMDQAVREKYAENEKFNILAIIKDLDGTSVMGVVRGFKVDVEHWRQYNKAAFVSDKDWLNMSTNVQAILPGIKAKHFQPEELEAAWKWVQE